LQRQQLQTILGDCERTTDGEKRLLALVLTETTSRGRSSSPSSRGRSGSPTSMGTRRARIAKADST